LQYLDLEYIRKSIPIADVAAELNLHVAGKMVHCWRADNHEHADRTASVGVWGKRNRAKCFVCDPKPLSPIDLVMSVRNVNLKEAVRWIAARWNIPPAPPGRHINHQQRWPEHVRVGTCGSPLELLVRSGVWASLTPAQRSIIPVLLIFTDLETGKATISYRGIMRHAGVQSQTTVAQALKRFEALHLLVVDRTHDGEGFRNCNSYRLCFDDPAFHEVATGLYRAQRQQIEHERELRREARRTREANRKLPVKALSNQWSSVQNRASSGWSVKTVGVPGTDSGHG
jgi:hypothetical protein